MSWIIDCSFSAALFLPDEKSDKVASFFEKLNENVEVLVPSLWWYEITNLLSVAVNRNRLVHSDVVHIMSLIDKLGYLPM